MQSPLPNKSGQTNLSPIPICFKFGLLLCALAALPAIAAAQPPSEFRQILDRLDNLEKANRELTNEVRALRKELAAANSRPADARSADQTANRESGPAAGRDLPDYGRALRADVEPVAPRPAAAGPDLEDQVAILNSRVTEQAQTKVESGQRFGVKLTGMVLMNAFMNSRQAGGEENPTYAAGTGESTGGASFRQSMIGLQFNGPTVFGGGKLSGNLMMDFYGGSGQSLDQSFRLRTGYMQIDWKRQSLTVGLDKPILSPREPTSLASIATSPLAGAGNLWMWTPQIRFEQRFQLSDTSTIRAQAGVVQTQESSFYQGGNLGVEMEPQRPGFQSRVEFAHDFGNGRRFEFAPGMHVSTSHVEHTSVPSRVYSADWLLSPWRKLEFTGGFFQGQNLAHLGTGGTGPGFVVLAPGIVRPIHSIGGWGQVSLLATDRLSFHFFSGTQNDRNRDLVLGRINQNFVFGANAFYKLSPNFIVAFEASQARTDYINIGLRLNNHYDLAFAYLF